MTETVKVNLSEIEFRTVDSIISIVYNENQKPPDLSVNQLYDEITRILKIRKSYVLFSIPRKSLVRLKNYENKLTTYYEKKLSHNKFFAQLEEEFCRITNENDLVLDLLGNSNDIKRLCEFYNRNYLKVVSDENSAI